MSQFVRHKSILYILLALALVSVLLGGIVQFEQTTPTHATGSNSKQICSKFDPQKSPLSSGARMWCFGPQPSGKSSESTRATTMTGSKISSNVNAADAQEDISPSGVRGYGQSETSIAAVGPYVVEAWNDSTGFFSPACSPLFKDQFTGFTFSTDGGASFTDKGSLPNTGCATTFYAGDPSVEVWRSGGTAYFYIGSLFENSAGIPLGGSQIAMTVCKATGTKLTCNSKPILIANGAGDAFLDKDFLSIDPQRGRLYISYTRFTFTGSGFGQIELAVCDIGTPSGGTGPAGGTAWKPACTPGTIPTPYLVVAHENSSCFQTGAYPTVDVKRGDLYVAWEFNWISNQDPPCNSLPTKNEVARVPFSCLTLPTSSCTRPSATASVKIVSMVASFIPGNNRGSANDFPRIAVSDKAGTVSIVWNDARQNLLGDILLQSFNLVTLSKVQATPVKLNTGKNGVLHLMPALRNADANGRLNVSWYDRRPNPNTDLTDVFAALSVNPRTTSVPSSNTRVTTASSGWLDTASVIIPNFGDYTDNYVIATLSAPYTGGTLYLAWSDGRQGVPQPYEAHGPTS